MFVSIVFDVEYWGMGERYKWFLKNISHAKQNDCLVITHEYLKNYYEEYAGNCETRFYNELDMRRLDATEYRSISKGFVNDKVFNDLEEQSVSRSEMLSYLLQNRYKPLEDELVRIIEEELAKRKEKKIDAIFNCLDVLESINYLGRLYKCPVISYCFSAVKKIHGYKQTLYYTAIDVPFRQSKETERRYNNYRSGKQVPLLLSNRELLAIFGKDKNIPLLKIMDFEPEHELGICKMACSIYPYDYLKYKYTDTDLYYEARRKLKTTDIIIREHPGIPWNGNDKGYKKEHERNDPVSFILSCKKVASIDSQILLKALLWNRPIYTKGAVSSFEFMCATDICDIEKIDRHKLNYYIFAYLIPAAFMFDAEYWKWRLHQKPSEYDIYMKHLNYYIDFLGYDKKLFWKVGEEERFRYILNQRNIDKNIVDNLLEKKTDLNINYEVLYSKIGLKKIDNTAEEITCVNEQLGNIMQSKFVFENEKEIVQVVYYPFVDVGGFVQIKSYRIDDIEVDQKGAIQYIEKVNGGINMDIKEVFPGEHEIVIEWEYCFK